MMKKNSSISERASVGATFALDTELFSLSPALPFPIYLQSAQGLIRWRDAGQLHQLAVQTIEPYRHTLRVKVEDAETYAFFLDGKLRSLSRGSAEQDELFVRIATLLGQAIERALHHSPWSIALYGLAKRWANVLADHLAQGDVSPALDRHVVQGLGPSHAIRTALMVGWYEVTQSAHRQRCEAMMLAALCHDIGHVLYPTHSDTQIAAADPHHDHPHLSIKLLASAGPIPPLTFNAILGHHERPDGRGYPHGIHGRDLGYGARLLGCANLLDHALIHGGGAADWHAAVGRVTALGDGAYDPQILSGFVGCERRHKDSEDLSG
ncbi:MAG: HD domain-containing phosphohydrolase [Myxococcota bacterium]|nr:HD domain-containing phosphohydrolase [Myxococcota bacterium]